MRTIGIRVAPTALTFAVYDRDLNTVVNVEEIKISPAFDVPDALKYVRNNLLDVLREFGVQRAGIRTTEPTAKQISIERVQIEGVVLEAFASSDLVGYYVGQIATIASRVGIERADFKRYIDGEL